MDGPTAELGTTHAATMEATSASAGKSVVGN
jgi:hypothetical protein